MKYLKFDEAIPLDSEEVEKGSVRIRELKVGIQERLERDHFFSGGCDSDSAFADGYHKQVTLENSSSLPVRPNGVGQLYVNSGNLMFRDNQNRIIQLTQTDRLFLTQIHAELSGVVAGITNEMTNESSIRINYPSGFNNSNSYIAAFKISNTACTEFYQVGYGINASINDSYGIPLNMTFKTVRVSLRPTDITIAFGAIWTDFKNKKFIRPIGNGSKYHLVLARDEVWE